MMARSKKDRHDLNHRSSHNRTSTGSTVSSRQPLLTVLLVLVLLVVMFPLSSCQKDNDEGLVLGTPQVQPPTIVSPGVLRVGVDSSRPPFAGKSDSAVAGSEIIGLDVDIAAALAEHLGLKLDLIDLAGLTSEEINDLFINSRLDIMMGYLPENEAHSPYVLVGPYMVDAPAIFTRGLSLPPQGFDLSSLTGARIAATPNSLSAWQIQQRFGVDAVVAYPTLEEAFTALDNNEVTYLASDAIVGSYLATRYRDILCMGFIDKPANCHIAIKAGNQELTDAVTMTMRTLRDNGVLKVIITKWLGKTACDVVMNYSSITGSGALSSTPPDLGDNLPDPSNANSSGTSDDNP